MKSHRFSQFAAAVFVAVSAGLAGCAMVAKGPPPEEIVKNRAQARWNALVQGDIKTAYSYYTPGTRQTFSLADFAAGIKLGFWKKVTVDKVECGAPDRCEVSTTIEYGYRGQSVQSPSREVWIHEGSDWWLVRR